MYQRGCVGGILARGSILPSPPLTFSRPPSATRPPPPGLSNPPKLSTPPQRFSSPPDAPPSSTFQKQDFRVGCLQKVRHGNADVPHENTDFQTKCWKVVQLLRPEAEFCTTFQHLCSKTMFSCGHLQNVWHGNAEVPHENTDCGTKSWKVVQNSAWGRNKDTSFQHFVPKYVLSYGTPAFPCRTFCRRHTRKHCF